MAKTAKPGAIVNAKKLFTQFIMRLRNVCKRCAFNKVAPEEGGRGLPGVSLFGFASASPNALNPWLPSCYASGVCCIVF